MQAPEHATRERAEWQRTNSIDFTTAVVDFESAFFCKEPEIV